MIIQCANLNAHHGREILPVCSIEDLAPSHSEISKAQLHVYTYVYYTTCMITLYIYTYVIQTVLVYNLTPTLTANSISSEARAALTFKTTYCILTLSIRMTIISAQ